jgi:hypothetical protein
MKDINFERKDRSYVLKKATDQSFTRASFDGLQAVQQFSDDTNARDLQSRDEIHSSAAVLVSDEELFCYFFNSWLCYIGLRSRVSISVICLAVLEVLQ